MAHMTTPEAPFEGNEIISKGKRGSEEEEKKDSETEPKEPNVSSGIHDQLSSQNDQKTDSLLNGETLKIWYKKSLLFIQNKSFFHFFGLVRSVGEFEEQKPIIAQFVGNASRKWTTTATSLETASAKGT